MLQTDAFQAINNTRATEIIAQARPIHEKLIGEVLEAALAFSSALEAEEAFRIELARDDVVSMSSTVLTPVPYAMRNVLTRRNWSSPLNYLGRAVVGPAWHNSK